MALCSGIGIWRTGKAGPHPANEEARATTDKVIAETPAQLLKTDLLPRSWVPSDDIHVLRQLQ